MDWTRIELYGVDRLRGSSTAAWIRDLTTQLPARYPIVLGVVRSGEPPSHERQIGPFGAREQAFRSVTGRSVHPTSRFTTVPNGPLRQLGSADEFVARGCIFSDSRQDCETASSAASKSSAASN